MATRRSITALVTTVVLMFSGPALANKDWLEGRIPPPEFCQWATPRMYYDVTGKKGSTCYAFGHRTRGSFIVTSVVRGAIEGEVAIGIITHETDGYKKWISRREIEGTTTEVRVIPGDGTDSVIMHGLQVRKGKGRVDFAFREINFLDLFWLTIDRIGRTENFVTSLAQLGLALEQERQRTEAGRTGRQINIDPTSEHFFKLIAPFIKETAFGCGDTDLAKQEALAGMAVSAVLRELDVVPARRVIISTFVTNWIGAYNELMYRDLRRILGDKCAR